MSAEHEWLNLLEVSGPFLAVPVLHEVFPQGLEELDSLRARRLRSAYEEWRDAVDGDDADRDKLHAAWIDEVLRTALEADDQLLKAGTDVPASVVELPEHGTTIVPEFVFVDPTHGGAVLALIHVFPPDTDLSGAMKFAGLSCSPCDRMALHLRALNIPCGMVTNGERWMLVHAPTGQVATFASWYARIWSQEPATLRAFVSLLGVRRFFAPAQDRLPALFDRSVKYQDEVTDALGDQVRRAIEVLMQALDRADQDRNRELLRDVKPQELYEAGLTVMMRLVFLLAAEERGLLLLGEPRYDAFYAVSTLRMQLRAESDEILERRRAAWSRLLAVSRAVFGGIDHPTLHLPAMGGSLFDPDRYPFLEGRLKGTSWRQHRAEPLPIDDRTVLLLLEAIQTFEGRTLSYRALDVEQIGHVYEGLLERTVSRVEEVTLELQAGAQAKNARVTLGELESAHLDGKAAVTKLLVDRSKRSQLAIEKELATEVGPRQSAHLLSACRGEVKLRDRLEPYVRLLRTDPWGYPLVHPRGAFVVVVGADRRETGTHYTPKSLTERIVEETLTPLVYDGPAKGAPRAEWKLKTPDQLLDLKVCDPAMGSGAFLVQACRFLSARVVEAWAKEEADGYVVDMEGNVHTRPNGFEQLPSDAEARIEQARRLVAERCLYGVDQNRLAVELAKLSLWLITLAKGRPFGFLDHNLRCGDSLLGIHRLDQITQLSMNPTGQGQLRLFGQNIEQAVHEAIELRQRLREIPIRDIRDVEAMAHLDVDARRRLEVPESIADAFIGEVFASGGKDVEPESELGSLSAHAGQVVGGDLESLTSMRRRAVITLSTGLSGGKPARQPFHWPLEFPEVFASVTPGFDATLGNPPWGASLSETDTRHLRKVYQNSAYKLINSFKFFIERMDQITRNAVGAYSFLVPSSLLEHIGCRDTRAFLLSRSPTMFIDCGDGMFHGVTQSCCFGVINKRAGTEDHLVILSTYEGYCQPEATRQIGPRTSKTIQQIKSRKNSVLSHGADTKHVSGGASVPLVELADVFDSGIDYSRAALGNAVFYSGQVADDPSDHKVLRGRNIGKYSLAFEGIWLRNDWRGIQQEHIAVDSKSRLKVNEKAYVVSPKIIVRQTGDQIIATVDVDRFYHQKSLLCIIPKSGISAFFLCAVLNHPKMTEIYRGMTMQSGRVFSQVKKNFLEQLPIPSSFDQSAKERIAGLAERLISAHEHDASLLAQLEDEVGKGFAGGEAVTPEFTPAVEQQGETS